MIRDTVKNIHWNNAATLPALDATSLHLWRIPTGIAGGSAEALKKRLSPQEIARAERLRLPNHRDRFIRAHAGLRKILASYLSIDTQQIDFIYGSAGKPALAATWAGLEFNLTTSGDLALVAVSASIPIGIDCEQVRERTHFIAIAERMFAPDTAKSVAEASEDRRPERFYRAWTALEARVKEDGRGLFHGRDGATATPPVAHFAPSPGFIAAVARYNLPAVSDWATLQIQSD